MNLPLSRRSQLACPTCHGEMKAPRFASLAIGEGVFWLGLSIVFAGIPAIASGFRAFAIGTIVLILLVAATFMLDLFVLRYRCSECGDTFTRHEIANRYPNGNA